MANFRLSIDVNTITRRGSAAACDKFNVIAAPHLQTEAREAKKRKRKKKIIIYLYLKMKISIIKKCFGRYVNVVWNNHD